MTSSTQTCHTCGFVPFPGNGAYGHWSCELSRWHFGAHRFRNYTIARVPRFWRVRDLWRVFDHSLRSRRMARAAGVPRGAYRPLRRALYPTTYKPIPYQPAERASS